MPPDEPGQPPQDVELEPVFPAVDGSPLEVSGAAPLEIGPAPESSSVPRRDPFWGYGDLALIVGLVFASFILLGLMAAGMALIYPKLQTDQTPLIMPVQLASYILIYLSFWLVFRTRYREPVLRSLGWRSSRLNLWWAAGGGALLAVLLSGLASVLHTPKVSSPFDKLTSSRLNLTLLGIVSITLAPLFEEMFFRGFLQPLLARSWGPLAGVLVTAVLFGSLHGPEYSWVWQYALFVTLAGAVFGWVRAKTNSIIPSTVMHGCFNAVSFAALAFGKNS